MYKSMTDIGRMDFTSARPKVLLGNGVQLIVGLYICFFKRLQAVQSA